MNKNDIFTDEDFEKEFSWFKDEDYATLTNIGKGDFISTLYLRHSIMLKISKYHEFSGRKKEIWGNRINRFFNSIKKSWESSHIIGYELEPSFREYRPADIIEVLFLYEEYREENNYFEAQKLLLKKLKSDSFFENVYKINFNVGKTELKKELSKLLETHSEKSIKIKDSTFNNPTAKTTLIKYCDIKLWCSFREVTISPPLVLSHIYPPKIIKQNATLKILDEQLANFGIHFN